MSRKIAHFTLFIALLPVLVCAACNQTADAPLTSPGLPKEGGELIVALDADILSLDPALSVDPSTALVTNQVVETLLKFDENGHLIPGLAERWEALDARTYRFTLRRGIIFHDETSMTAEDVIFSLEHARSVNLGALGSNDLENIDEIDKLDDYTVQVKLARPDVLFLQRMASSAGHVLSKAHVQIHSENFGSPEAGLIGSGPYKFATWTPGVDILLEKNQDYWNKDQGGPYLNTIRYMVFPAVTTRMAYLQSGVIDLAFNIPSDQIPIVQRSKTNALWLSEGLRGDALVFNSRRPPFDNRKLRQAINLAVDKTGTLRALWGEAGTPARATVITPAMWTFEEEQWQAAWERLPDYPRDLEKARRAFDESGVSVAGLQDRVILVDDSPIHLGEALVVQAAAKELGIHFQIKKVTPLELRAAVSGAEWDYDMLIFTWNSELPDPAAGLVTFFHSPDRTKDLKNVAGYSNPDVDRLLDEQERTLDVAERARLLIQAQVIIAEDTPWMIFGYPKCVMALNRRFSGYTVTPTWQWDAFGHEVYLTSP